MHRSAARAVVLCCTVLLPTVLFGADPAAGGDQNPMAPVFSTSIWALGIFVVVLGLLWKLAWGPLLKALDDRETKIRESLEAAIASR